MLKIERFLCKINNVSDQSGPNTKRLLLFIGILDGRENVSAYFCTLFLYHQLRFRSQSVYYSGLEEIAIKR